MYSAVGPCSSGLREIRMSPSPTPMVAVSPNARLKPPLGRPMLSMMVSISRGGITCRISRSMSAKSTSVCFDARARGSARVQPHLRRNPRWGKSRGR